VPTILNEVRRRIIPRFPSAPSPIFPRSTWFLPPWRDLCLFLTVFDECRQDTGMFFQKKANDRLLAGDSPPPYPPPPNSQTSVYSFMGSLTSYSVSTIFTKTNPENPFVRGFLRTPPRFHTESISIRASVIGTHSNRYRHQFLYRMFDVLERKRRKKKKGLAQAAMAWDWMSFSDSPSSRESVGNPLGIHFVTKCIHT